MITRQQPANQGTAVPNKAAVLNLLFRFVLYPLGVGGVGLNVEFHDTRGFVGMDSLHRFLHLGPIFFLGFDEGHDFFACNNFVFPPVRAFNREIVHTGDEPVAQ